MTEFARTAAQWSFAMMALSLGVGCIAGASWAWVALFLWAKRDWQKLNAPPVAEKPSWRRAA